MMRRRWPWVLGIALGLPVCLIGAFLAWTVWSGRTADSPLADVEVKELPAAWQSASEDVETTQTPSSTLSTAAPADAAPAPADSGLLTESLEGVLAFVGRGRPFGGERYAIEPLPEGGARLASSGAFEFKVVLATIRVPFTQELTLDAALNPQVYRLHIDGVVGFGERDVEMAVEGDLARIRSGDATRETPLGPNRPFIIGTFATYALVPLLLAGEPPDAEVTFDLFAFGGPPGDGDDDETEARPAMTFGPLEKREILVGQTTFQVDARPVRSELGDSLLLSTGKELLGVVAWGDGGEAGLVIYRADYFPDGFELLP